LTRFYLPKRNNFPGGQRKIVIKQGVSLQIVCLAKLKK